jgi:hypothetical protein
LAFGTLDQAVTITYFSSGQNIVLPVDCEANKTLRALNLFYDKGEFNRLKNYHSDFVFLLPSSASDRGPNKCSQDYMISAYGEPMSVTIVPGVGTAFIYPNRTTLKIKS